VFFWKTYLIHRDQGVPEAELIAESRYADVIITGSTVLASSPLDMPAGLVKELLAKSECPVMTAPHHTEPIDSILFAYDGNASSVFAVKQFTYLFPELKDAELTVLQADENAVFDKEQKEKLYEYLKEHYSRISFNDLHGKPEDELFDYALREENACLVMGAFGRNWFSSLFKVSTADLLIKINNLPVFIAHR
jgi:nucleotide-binding universal stress UspA family protein